MMQLHRLFPAFPAGLPGVGLLLLRAVVGATLVTQGLVCLLSAEHSTALLPLIAALLLISGVFLLLGFLTPILSPLACIECLGTALSWFPPQLWIFPESKVAIAQLIAVSAAIALLGPGAFSVDARLFGWKEIVIPPACRPPQDK
jgi:uncharacterized membrane protein YphA (DoxX/SURF4 family)